jgi:alanine dehydrogenase
MKIGLVREIKVHEYRVGLTPSCVQQYIQNGHTVYVETDAGVGAGFLDKEYEDIGGIIVKNKQKLFDDSEMIIKVKEPLKEEYDYFHEGQILYTYLHIAADKPQALALLEKKSKSSSL